MSYNRHNRKYFINDKFFDEWNVNMSYVLGYLAADGYICTNGNNISFGISAKDLDQLENIRELMGTDSRIEHYLSKPSKLVTTEREIVRLTISSKVLRTALVKLGITSKKSLTLSWFDDCPKELIPHLIRGYFDGDGWTSISTNHQSRLRAGIVGNYDFLLGAANNIPIEHPKIITYEKEHWSDLRYNGPSALQFLNFIYKDSTLLTRMKRKYDLYQKALQIEFRVEQSKYKGVSKSSGSRWRSFIQINNKYKALGIYANEEDAARAYDKYVIENRLNRKTNFPTINEV